MAPRAQGSLLCRLTATGLLGVVMAVISALALAKFSEAEWFTQGGPYASDWVGYDKEQFVGAVIFTFFTPVAFTLLFVCAQQTVRCLSHNIYLQFPILLISVGALITGVILSSFWAHEMAQCVGVGCVNPEKFPPPEESRPEAGIGWQTQIGISGIFCFGMLAVSMSLSFLTEKFRINFWSPFYPSWEDPLRVQTVPLINESVANDVQEEENKGLLRKQALTSQQQSPPLHLYQESLLLKVLLYLFVFIFLFFFYFSTTYIPNSWEYFTANRIASFSSQGTSGDPTKCVYGQTSCPEYPDAAFTTSNIKLASWWILKIYPSNLFFFVYLMAVPLLGVLFLSTPTTRKWFSKSFSMKIRFPLISGSYFFSVGEVIMALFFSLLVILWTYYWWHDHNYNGYWPSGEILDSERAARSLGQVAVLFMGLVFIPASRIPLLFYFFGVSWEEGIKYHRWIGILFLGASLSHMIANYVWIAEKGDFPHDILAVPMSLPSSLDNWTVPLITVAFWISFLLIFLAVFDVVRRKYFELFYYAHHIAYCVLIPTVLWHAAAGWEFLLPGVTIWFFDRCIRAYRSAQSVQIIKLNTVHCGQAGDVTQIIVKPNFTFYPGQYCFINVAELSLFEWHPFTISSATSSELTFDIKSMGDRTFTGKLFDLVHLKKSSDGSTPPLTISIDGPYGKSIDYSQYNRIYFIAGGIGITPVKSVFSTLMTHFFNGSPSIRDLKRVHLIWVSREASLFNLMEDTLMQLPRGPFSAHLFATESTSQGSDSDLLTRLRTTTTSTTSRLSENNKAMTTTLSTGRPNLRIELNVADFQPPSTSTLVFACGPTKMLDDCAQIAKENNWDFHKEIFDL